MKTIIRILKDKQSFKSTSKKCKISSKKDNKAVQLQMLMKLVLSGKSTMQGIPVSSKVLKEKAIFFVYHKVESGFGYFWSCLYNTNELCQMCILWANPLICKIQLHAKIKLAKRICIWVVTIVFIHKVCALNRKACQMMTVSWNPRWDVLHLFEIVNEILLLKLLLQFSYIFKRFALYFYAVIKYSRSPPMKCFENMLHCLLRLELHHWAIMYHCMLYKTSFSGRLSSNNADMM